YTVIGDGVNVAARLEGINREYGTRICISHTVYREAGERLCVRPIDDVVVKGRRGTIAIYELAGVYGSDPELEPDESTVRLCRLSRLAREAVLAGDIPLALSRYSDILAEFPHDMATRRMIGRLTARDAVALAESQAAK
ncbi:MAG TPA: hypothetical protein VM782_02275, partial [Stellaceae bacterium]|nr:hypothetical protein [Stellaceae bacterium]